MQKMNRKTLSDLMHRLRQCYPLRSHDEVEWQASIIRFWDYLHPKDARAVVVAFNRAPISFPDWFPTVGQMAELVDACAKGLPNLDALQITRGTEMVPDHDENLAEVRKIVTSLAAKKVIQ